MNLKMQKVTGATKMLNISGNRTSNSLRDDDKKYSDFFFQFNDRALFHLFVERETEELLVCNK